MACIAPTARRILLLSVSAGAGHVRAAEAIRAHAGEYRPDVEILHIDVMDHVPAGFRRLYTDAYIALVDHCPALWSWLYRSANRAQPASLLQKLRRGVERLNTGGLLKALKAFAPDAIVCTHFLPAEILAHMIRNGRVNCPVWVQVTDFDLHRIWVQPHMRGYFAGNAEVAFRMREQGIAPDSIHVTGIPVMPGFGRPPARHACAPEFGLDPERTTVLLMGGGAGMGRLHETAARLLACKQDFQLVVLAGRNAFALMRLQQLAVKHPGRLFPQAYTPRIERLMACADFAITKPGGLTVSECLAMGLPMIVNAPIPGQEERNADFLLEQGVALKACDLAALEYRLHYLLSNPAALEAMRKRAAPLGRPHAARDVLDVVLA